MPRGIGSTAALHGPSTKLWPCCGADVRLGPAPAGFAVASGIAIPAGSGVMTTLHGPFIVIFGIAVALIGGLLCRYSCQPLRRTLSQLYFLSNRKRDLLCRSFSHSLLPMCWKTGFRTVQIRQ